MTYRYMAYIDEAGDDGLRAVKPLDQDGSSEWLILSAVVVAADRERELSDWIAVMMDAVRAHQRQLNVLHFSKLFPTSRRIVCSSIATLPFAVSWWHLTKRTCADIGIHSRRKCRRKIGSTVG